MLVESVLGPSTLDTKGRLAVLKALADEVRIQIVNALLERPHCVEELAERLRRAPSTISFHVRKLDEAGLLTRTRTQYYLLYELKPEWLRVTLRELVSGPSPEGSPERRRLQRYREKVVRAFFRDGELVALPKQWRKRRVVLEEFLSRFEPGRTYAEQEVNERIQALYPDHCTIRRLLIDEGYMEREGQTYRSLHMEHTNMTSHKELKRQYRETPKQSGIFQIRNKVNGKVLLGSSTNLHGPFNKHRFMLSIGSHLNRELQDDWNRHGADAFEFQILELVKVKDSPEFSLEDELTLLEQIWLEKLQPLEPNGYNQTERIRE